MHEKLFRSFEPLYHFIDEGSKVKFQPSSQPYCLDTIQRVILEGEIFREFHKSSSIRENFTLEMFLFSRLSTKSVTIHENFALEKLGRLDSQKFSPSKITRYTVMEVRATEQ